MRWRIGLVATLVILVVGLLAAGAWLAVVSLGSLDRVERLVLFVAAAVCLTALVASRGIAQSRRSSSLIERKLALYEEVIRSCQCRLDLPEASPPDSCLANTTRLAVLGSPRVIETYRALDASITAEVEDCSEEFLQMIYAMRYDLGARNGMLDGDSLMPLIEEDQALGDADARHLNSRKPALQAKVWSAGKGKLRDRKRSS